MFPSFTQVIRKVSKIHCRLPAGGILVFLTGKREIDYVVAKLRKKFSRRAQQKVASGIEACDGAGESKVDADHRNTGNDTAAKMDMLDKQDSEPFIKRGRLIGEEEEDDDEEEGGEKHVLEADELTYTHSAHDLAAEAEESEEDAEEGNEVKEEQEYDYELDEGVGEDADVDNSDDALEEDLEEEDENGGPVLVLPLYSMLPAAEQMRVWNPPRKGTRLIVVATNVGFPSSLSILPRILII